MQWVAVLMPLKKDLYKMKLPEVLTNISVKWKLDEKIIVGVNKFQSEEGAPIPVS